MTYALRVKFKSNEAPWSGGYQPASWHQPKDDEAAIKWAVEMSDGLGLDYLVTLTKDDAVIPLPIRDLPDDVLERERVGNCEAPNGAGRTTADCPGAECRRTGQCQVA